MEQNDRVRFGQVYSPTVIVDYILEKTLGPVLAEKPVDRIKVLEPACGDGRFLSAVCERLITEYIRLGFPWTHAVRNLFSQQLFGMDIDAQAVKQACALLHSQTGYIPEHVVCGDTLDKTSMCRELPLVANCYDLIIGNPPYVTWEISAQARALYRDQYCTAASGRMNLYRLFIERCLELLKPDGYLGFICPNTYLTDRDSKLLRKMLLTQTHIQEIVFLPESAPVFSGVTQATTILIVQKKAHISRNHKVGVKKISEILQLEQQATYIPQWYWQEKTDGEFQLLPVWDTQIIEKLYRGCRLGKMANIYQGEVNLTLHKDELRDTAGTHQHPLIRGCHIIPYGFIDERQRGKLSYIQPSRPLREHARASRLVFQQVSNAVQFLRLKCGLLTPRQPVYCANSTNYVLLPDQDIMMYNYLMALGHSTVWNVLFNLSSSTNHITVRELSMLPVPDCPPPLRRRLALLVRKARGIKEPAAVEKIRCEIDKIIYRLFSLEQCEIELMEKYRKQCGKGLP